MILFNTTYCVDASRTPEFISFISSDYIPSALAAGLCNPLLSEVRGGSDTDAATGEATRTFALQLRAHSADAFSHFHDTVLPAVYRRLAEALGESTALFETVLDIVHDPCRQ